MKGNFNTKRICLLVRANIMENSKKTLYFWGVCTILFGFLIYSNTLAQLRYEAKNKGNISNIDSSITDEMEMLFRTPYPIYIFVIGVAMCYVAFILFRSNMKKLNMTHRATLPASITEKYVANIIPATIIAPILAAISIAVVTLYIDISFKLLYGVEIIYNSNLSGITPIELTEVFVLIIPFLLYVMAMSIVMVEWSSNSKSNSRSVLHLFIVSVFIFGSVHVTDYIGFESKGFVYHTYFLALAAISLTTSYYMFKRKELKQ